jgi:hypothetical protein
MSHSRKQHPLLKFEGSVLWRTVSKEIAALVKNRGLKELTAREYIVGAVCQPLPGAKNKIDSKQPATQFPFLLVFAA